jgi:leader peptidase (prepilin peptidase)/N-methyltransferase
MQLMIIDTGISSASISIIGFVLGAIIGSFLNVVILRLPRIIEAQWTADARAWLNLQSEPKQPFNLAVPGSHCGQCGSPIKPLHNIPIISFIFLRGRCNQCRTPISIQYPLVEILTGLLSAYVLTVNGISALALCSFIFSSALILLTVIDYRHQLLPDQITLPLLWLGLLVNLDSMFASTGEAVLGAILGYMCLWVIYWLFKLTTGKEGMGYGDFKLCAALGAWLGWKLIPLLILLASSTAALIGICGILFAGREKGLPMAFGPYLCLSGWIALHWGDSIVSWYLSLITA